MSATRVYETLPKPVFVRKSVGTRKLAPIDMRKEEYQFVIEGFLINDVLNQIPDEIQILQAVVVITKRGTDHRVALSSRMRRLGITYIRQTEPVKTVHIKFDVTRKAEIRKNVTQACMELEVPFQKSFFKYIVLSNKEGAGKFKHCTKEIHPDASDKRKKLRVMGLVQGQGKVQSLVADLGAKKFKCSIKEEAVKLIMCSRE